MGGVGWVGDGEDWGRGEIGGGGAEEGGGVKKGAGGGGYCRGGCWWREIGRGRSVEVVGGEGGGWVVWGGVGMGVGGGMERWEKEGWDWG